MIYEVWQKFQEKGSWFLLHDILSAQLPVSDGPCRTAVCRRSATHLINLLNPTGHGMHQQFNIQQLYALHTLYLCVLYLSENKQRLVSLTA